MKQDALPEGMALVETADGRWFPAFAPLSETYDWVYILKGSPLPFKYGVFGGGKKARTEASAMMRK
jgi:hypothetical protein